MNEIGRRTVQEWEFPGGHGRLWTLAAGRMLAVPAEAGELLAPAEVALYEWTEYFARVEGAARLRVGERWVEPIEDGLFRIAFENELGLTRIQAFGEGRALGAGLNVEVISPKFPTLAAHVGFLRSLLDGLFARATRLPFAISAATARPVGEEPTPPTPLFTLHFLLQFREELRTAWNVIQARPYRRLADHPDLVPLGAVSDVDSDVLLSIVQAPERWVRARGFPLAERLCGYAPATVWQRLPEESLDTPENRFVLAFLRALLAAADRLPAERWWGQVSAERRAVVDEARTLLRLAVTQPLFADVGEMQRIPTTSRVLLRREGYRQMLELWRLFNSAQRPLFAPLQRAVELRSVDKLYEFWAFFALVEEIGVALGVAPVIEMSVSDEEGLEPATVARFGEVGALEYNRKVKGYSVWLRPDYLWKRGNKREVAFDAKFRLDRSPLADDSEELPEARARVEDLYKMHAYRDALGLRAAAVVYPGEVEWVYFLDGMHDGELRLRNILVGRLSGVGTIALRPENVQELGV